MNQNPIFAQRWRTTRDVNGNTRAAWLLFDSIGMIVKVVREHAGNRPAEADGVPASQFTADVQPRAFRDLLRWARDNGRIVE